VGIAGEDGRIIAWRKREGEAGHKGDVLLEVETDKANLEVEAAADGNLVLVKEGACVHFYLDSLYLRHGRSAAGRTGQGR
jgi:pyruvate/2-oxoglutarate dehydrogenase complex dihydrolipoamide acyltransferase (E2) component